MSISDVTLSSQQGLAIFAALAGAAFLLLGRRSATRNVLVTITAFVALAAVLAGVQLVQLKPTHALLTDSESTAPQSVVAPADSSENETGDVSSAGRDVPRATSSDGTDDATKSDPDKRSAPTPHAEPPVASPSQPDPSPIQESPGADADPDTGG